jgi:hypothetical protein
MRTEVQESLQTQFQRALRLAARVLIAALLTALVGAAENWFYERFFAPELYVTGDPVVRAAFAATLTFPFILAGLVIRWVARCLSAAADSSRKRRRLRCCRGRKRFACGRGYWFSDHLRFSRLGVLWVLLRAVLVVGATKELVSAMGRKRT